MNAMPLAAATLAAATLLVSAGCRAQQPVLCSDTKPTNGPVYIEIDASTPTPTVTPKACQVIQGASITWISNTKAFSLRFADRGNPGGKGLPKDPSSSPSNGKQQYNINARADEGEYQYDVMIAGKSMDPAIIIRKSQ